MSHHQPYVAPYSPHVANTLDLAMRNMGLALSVAQRGPHAASNTKAAMKISANFARILDNVSEMYAHASETSAPDPASFSVPPYLPNTMYTGPYVNQNVNNQAPFDANNNSSNIGGTSRGRGRGNAHMDEDRLIDDAVRRALQPDSDSDSDPDPSDESANDDDDDSHSTRSVPGAVRLDLGKAYESDSSILSSDESDVDMPSCGTDDADDTADEESSSTDVDAMPPGRRENYLKSKAMSQGIREAAFHDTARTRAQHKALGIYS